MPAPRLLPDTDVLLRLRANGWRYSDIAALYGTSEQGVYMRLHRASVIKKTQPSYKHLIPWTVRKQHTFAFPVQMLRALGQVEAGKTLSPVRQRMLDRWLRGIKENGIVLCYHPEVPPNPASTVGGFYYARRRPEDGESLIRVESPANAPGA